MADGEVAGRKGMRKLRKAVFGTINELRPATHGHNLSVKVLEGPTISTRSRSQGGTLRIAEYIVGDKTGVILFAARNEQAEMLKKGKVITIRNGKIDMYKGSMRLAVDKWGLIEDADAEGVERCGKDILLDNNLSAVEYELINVPVEKPSS